MNYRTTHFLVVSKALFFPYDEINRHKLVGVLTYFRCTDYIRSEYAVPTKRAISEELQRKNGYSLSSRYFPIHSNEKTNKRLDKTRINENFGQYSFFSSPLSAILYVLKMAIAMVIMLLLVTWTIVFASSKTGILPNCLCDLGEGLINMVLTCNTFSGVVDSCYSQRICCS